MDTYTRHQKIWRLLYALANRWICHKFNLSHEDLHVDGPVLLIPNHVTTWDPLLVGMSLRDKQVYYVASEHLFRLGFVTRLLNWLVAPIPRRKASMGTDTVKICLRHLRAGHSVCIFAEGEQTWDGRSGQVFPATGKLAKSSGATLVTYKLEGGYLSLPRWGKGVRRGRMHGRPVNIYPPELLKSMSAEEVNAAINRDIYEDAWQRQREEGASFRGKNPAEGLERALYLCPGCGRVGTLRTRGEQIFCGCGLELRYTESGFFEPRKPFPSIAEWEQWQKEALRELERPQGQPLFSDPGLRLSKIGAEHAETELEGGELRQFADRLCCGEYSFPLQEISSMAMVKTDLLLLSYRGEYYQIHAENGANLRKYLEIWKER